MTPERLDVLIQALQLWEGHPSGVPIQPAARTEIIAALRAYREVELLRPLLNQLCTLQDGNKAKLALPTEADMTKVMDFLLDAGAREHKCATTAPEKAQETRSPSTPRRGLPLICLHGLSRLRCPDCAPDGAT